MLFRLITTKNINKKKIIINRDYRFFMIFDLVLSLKNNWNYLVIY